MRINATTLLFALACLGLFAWGVERHAFVGDDAYIAFRYADHLAAGIGPVWNPGERVEGYTDFLWVVLLAGAMRIGLSPEVVANGIGIACGAALLVLLLVRASDRWSLAWAAPLALAAGRSFTGWSTGGLESTLFALLVFAGLERFARGSLRASSWLLAFAALTRPEGLLFIAVPGAFLAVDLLRQRRNVSDAAKWAWPWIVAVGAHVFWRRAYYGAWIPNSFHAKVHGAWWDQGLTYLGLFATDYLALPMILLAALAFRNTERRNETRLFGAASAAFLVWVAYAGGDRFEFRFLVFILPLLYAMAGDGLAHLARGKPAARALAALLAVALVGTAFRTHFLPGTDDRSGVAGLARIRDYADRRVAEGRFLRAQIEAGRLPDDLVLAVGGAGAVPWLTRWPTVDRRGINDRTIAAGAPEHRGIVAHELDASADYLASRNVAIFDVFNRIVHEPGAGSRAPREFVHDGRPFSVRVVRAGERELLFVTFLPEAEFRRVFGGLEIVR